MTADSVTLNAGSGGDAIATDLIGGNEYQYVKLTDGTIDSTTAIAAGNGLAAGALRVTVASDSTGVLSIDDNGGSLTVDGTVTANAGTGTFTVDGSGVTQPVSGTVTANLGATDNAVLDSIDTAVNGTLTVDLGANNDITVEGGAVLGTTGNAGPANAISVGGTEAGGTFREFAVDSSGNLQVDIVSGGTGSTQYAEDSVHTTGDTGTMSLFVRQDTQADFGADGDYVPGSIDANGALRVNAVNAGGTSNVDTAAGGTDQGAVMLAVRDDALTTLTPVDGDYTHLRVSSTGALHVTGAGGGTQYNIDDALGATDTVTLAGVVRDDSLSTLTEADGDVSVLRVSSTGALHVTGGGGTEYTEDAAAPANPVGTATVMERDDALGGITPIAGDWSHQFCNANGALWTAVDGTVTVDGSGVTQPVSGTVTANLGATDNAVLDQIEVNTSYGDNTGNGTAAGSLRVTVASDSTGVISVDDNGGSLTIDGTVTANAGTGTMTVDLGANNDVALNAGSNLVGDVGLSGARTSGGTTLYRNVDVDETEDQVKGTAGQVYWLHAMNLTAAVLYLQIYNATAASVTVGTTTPDLTFPLATQGDTNGAGFTLAIPNGIELDTAITIACTTTIGGAGGPAANGCVVNLGYA